MSYSQLVLSLYADPMVWLMLAASAIVATLAAIGMAHVMGSDVPQRLTPRRLLLAFLIFLLTPILVVGPSGLLAILLYLIVATVVLGRQGMGPLVGPDEGRGVAFGWNAALARGTAFALGGMLVPFVMTAG